MYTHGQILDYVYIFISTILENTDEMCFNIVRCVIKYEMILPEFRRK